MIRVLPAAVVNQIAAGEVIERPFSVVKELVENSLDAGATRVLVEIGGGGRELVRVTDDGCGFSAGDLELAFASHATSKLAALADLDHIASLGFRGEALASIGSVSRCVIRSRPAGSEHGHEVRCHGGEVQPVRPAGCPPGTVVEVRDLFFNTPARRRFLKSEAAEKARIRDLLARLALARPEVAFHLVQDGRQVLQLPAGEDLAQRVGRAFGRELAAGLLPVERVWGDHAVRGLIAEPDAARRDSRLELLFINGRQAREAASTQAIRQAYREFLMHGRFPVYFLLLSLPPDRVDVNVHPRKAEVRFLECRKVAGLLHEAVAGALRARSGGALAGSAGGVVLGGDRPRARSGFPDLPRDLFGRTPAAHPAPPSAPGAVREGTPTPPAAAPHPFREVPGRFLQVRDLYLLFEGRDGLVVVDQHALHERVIYEKLKRRDRQRGAQVQRLLVPAVVELAAEDKEWLLAAAAELAAEGLLVEDFGPQAVAVQGMPAVLGSADPAAVLAAMLQGDDAGQERPSAREAIVERFHSMACRAAVMSGDRLTDEEIASLLRDAASLEHPHNCPHGRPTVLTFTTAELERYFRRRV